ncbi:hypothetical protein D4R78_03700 [bacterium]|nr:MAG: hypothetical protein D4R78_03700 [bacterium]
MKKWRVFITPAAERVSKKLPKKVYEFIFNKFPNQAKENPFIGEQLSGSLSWLRSFHFSIGNQPYRIAYNLDIKSQEIFIHYAGHRNDFYERLRKSLQLR